MAVETVLVQQCMDSLSILFLINHDVQMLICMDLKWVECTNLMAICDLPVFHIFAGRPLGREAWLVYC
jgi:hypothetical protein